MTKIWVFKPSEQWNHCGGGFVVIAPTYDRAASLLTATTGEEAFQSEDAVPDDKSFEIWVLVEAFDMLLTLPERVVLDDYNWA